VFNKPVNKREMTDEKTQAGRRALLFSIFTTAFVFFGRFGYDIGTGDQDEFLPFLVHVLDKAVLSNDWFVGAQVDGFNIRLPLVILLKPLATVLNPPSAVLIVYVCSFILASWATFLIARFIFDTDLVAVVATIIGLGVTKLWTLGGNDILTSMLVPSMVAWACALWAFLELIRGRPGRSGVLCGLAILFQPLVGIHMTLLCSTIVVLDQFRGRSQHNLKLNSLNNQGRIKRVWQAVQIPAVALAAGSAVLLPIFLDQWQHPLSPDSMAIFTLFRAPHHFIPVSFNQNMMWRFVALMLLAVLALFRPGLHQRSRQLLISALSIVILLLIVAYLNAVYLHVPILTKLQLFKFSVIGKLLAVVIISATVFSWILSDRLRDQLSSWLRHRWLWRSSAILFLVLLVSAWTYPPLTARNLPAVLRVKSTDAELYAWIVQNTQPEAVFTVPPDHTGFSYYARRPQYVNFKAFPYHEQDIQEWYRRVRRQASLTESAVSEPSEFISGSGGVSGLKELVKLYESATDTNLQRFAQNEGIQYILRRTPIKYSGPPDLINKVFHNRHWQLYRIDKAKS